MDTAAAGSFRLPPPFAPHHTMTVRVGNITFDHVRYHSEVGVLYLHVGDPRDAVDFDGTPDGHHLRFDAAGQLVGIMLLHPKSVLAQDGKILIGRPLQVPVEIGHDALDQVLAAA